MQLQVPLKVLDPTLPLPEYKHIGDAGFDLRASLEALGTEYLQPGQRRTIPCGIAVAIPEGFELQVRPRSGHAAKHGITVVNAPGTVDAGFRGEIKVILLNTGHEEFAIRHGDRIAQGVVAPVVRAAFVTVGELPPSDRGTNGYGSTGVV